MGGPLISVVIPCFNGCQFLESAVASALEQGEQIQAIVVDDGSSDQSLTLASGLIRRWPRRLLVVSQANQGQAAARNRGIALAEGRYISFLDADDLLIGGFVEPAVRLLVSQSRAVAVQGRVQLLDLHRPVEPWQRDAIESTIPGNLLIRTEIVRLMGGFPVNEAFRGPVGGEDGCFRAQLQTLGKIEKLDIDALKYRVRPGGHVDLFLDRSRFENGRIHFNHLLPEETTSIGAASHQYFEQVARRRLDQVLQRLRQQIGGADDCLRLQAHACALPGQVDTLEGLALHCFAREWPVSGATAALQPVDARALACLNGGCDAAGCGPVVAVAPASMPSWNQRIRILLLCAGDDAIAMADLAPCLRHLALHGLLMIHSHLANPHATALCQQLRAIPQLQSILELHHLIVFERIGN